jgi:peptidyl-prolyl cis-trans isomerase SurA
MKLFRVVLIVLGLALIPLGGTADRVVLEEIVARVNNRIITLADLERGRQSLREELAREVTGAELQKQLQEREKDLLRDLIDQTLLVQRGTDLGITVEADVIKRLDRIRQDAGLDSLEALERTAAAQGVDFEDFKEQIRNQLLTQAVVQKEVSGKVMIDAEEVRDYYAKHQQELQRPESVYLREILVSTEGVPPDGLPAREERVREVLAKIRAGEKFEELAKTYSDAPTKTDGGDLGSFEVEKLSPVIREAVAKLLEGGVTDPLRTPQGYLLLQKVAYMPAGIPPFEKVEGEIMQKLYYGKVQPALREYLNGLRRDAFLTVKAGYVDTGAVEPRVKPVVRGKRRRQTSNQ